MFQNNSDAQLYQLRCTTDHFSNKLCYDTKTNHIRQSYFSLYQLTIMNQMTASDQLLLQLVYKDMQLTQSIGTQ